MVSFEEAGEEGGNGVSVSSQGCHYHEHCRRIVRHLSLYEVRKRQLRIVGHVTNAWQAHHPCPFCCLQQLSPLYTALS